VEAGDGKNEKKVDGVLVVSEPAFFLQVNFLIWRPINKNNYDFIHV
jgi:hypothetical protein